MVSSLIIESTTRVFLYDSQNAVKLSHSWSLAILSPPVSPSPENVAKSEHECL